jgi:hypothetical protein
MRAAESGKSSLREHVDNRVNANYRAPESLSIEMTNLSVPSTSRTPRQTTSTPRSEPSLTLRREAVQRDKRVGRIGEERLADACRQGHGAQPRSVRSPRLS